MVALRERAPTRMSVDEFLAWDAADASGRRWQLVDGEPVLMAPAAERHGAIQAEIGRLIEILSPGNEGQTRSNIWTYATIPSVREIFAVRSTRMEVELLRRGPDSN